MSKSKFADFARQRVQGGAGAYGYFPGAKPAATPPAAAVKAPSIPGVTAPPGKNRKPAAGTGRKRTKTKSNAGSRVTKRGNMIKPGANPFQKMGNAIKGAGAAIGGGIGKGAGFVKANPLKAAGAVGALAAAGGLGVAGYRALKGNKKKR